MITNASPRPYVPGTPLKLNGLSTDEMPTIWGDLVVPNGSKFRVMDKDEAYIFDEENRQWHKWTEDVGGGSSGGDTPSGESIATDAEAADMIDDLFNRHKDGGD